MDRNSIKYLFYDLNAPKDTRILVAIPMYMYRIETLDFKKGLNFFQEMVLKFLVGPDINAATIAQYTGLDEKIILVIIGELKKLGLLTESSELTIQGRQYLDKSDGYIVDDEELKHGYIFQFVDNGRFYPFYIDKLLQSTLSSKGKLNTHKNIDWGEQEEEEIVFLNPEIQIQRQPTEHDILEFIDHTQNILDDCNIKSSDSLPSPDSLRIKWENVPELVYLCTYIYLNKSKEDELYYDDDLLVREPFGFNDSWLLSAYLKNIKDEEFNKYVNGKFKDLPKLHEKYIEEKGMSENDIADNELFNKLGTHWLELDRQNLRLLIFEIAKAFLKMKACKFKDYTSSNTFITSLQRVFETIIDYDIESRKSVYDAIDYEYFPPSNQYNFKDAGERRGKKLQKLYRDKINKNHHLPSFIKNRSGLWSNNTIFSLRPMIFRLFLTTQYDNPTKLVLIYDKYIDKIEYCVDGLNRNRESHGYSESKGIMASVDEECATKAYDYFIEFINEYFNIK